MLTPPIHLEDRVEAPVEPDRARLRDEFFSSIGSLTLGLVRGERWGLRRGHQSLLRLDAPSFEDHAWSWPIRGGRLARRPGGSLSYGWREGQLVAVVDGYHPWLPTVLYNLVQVPVHRLVTRLFLLRLRGRSPAPGVPAGPAQRLLTGGLDLVFCAALTAALRPRRRLAAFAALTAAYHVGFWTLGGRTPAARLAGQRLVSVDGGSVSLGQALVRTAALPAAARRGRALHDEAAGTEVIES